MTQDEKLNEKLRAMAADYNAPPALSKADLDGMWEAIEAERAPRASRPDGRATNWFSVRTIASLAAVLLIGVAIGRFSARRSPALVADAGRATRDSLAVPEPYQSTTSRYLGQAAALLVALPADVRADRADARYLGRAHDLLLTTRLLLDSPAAEDPRLRALLEDLELVLAQVVRLQTDEGTTELELIRQALDQRDVLPRLRTAVANISADD
jgi:hypothetical protein